MPSLAQHERRAGGGGYNWGGVMDVTDYESTGVQAFNKVSVEPQYAEVVAPVPLAARKVKPFSKSEFPSLPFAHQYKPRSTSWGPRERSWEPRKNDGKVFAQPVPLVDKNASSPVNMQRYEADRSGRKSPRASSRGPQTPRTPNNPKKTATASNRDRVSLSPPPPKPPVKLPVTLPCKSDDIFRTISPSDPYAAIVERLSPRASATSPPRTSPKASANIRSRSAASPPPPQAPITLPVTLSCRSNDIFQPISPSDPYAAIVERLSPRASATSPSKIAPKASARIRSRSAASPPPPQAPTNPPVYMKQMRFFEPISPVDPYVSIIERLGRSYTVPPPTTRVSYQVQELPTKSPEQPTDAPKSPSSRSSRRKATRSPHKSVPASQKQANSSGIEMSFVPLRQEKPGFRLDAISGEVLAITGEQAEKKGVQVGWIVQKIDGAAYNKLLYQEKLFSNKRYILSFKTAN